MIHLDLVPHIQRKPTSMDSLSFPTRALADLSWRLRPKDFNPIPPMFICPPTLPVIGLCNSRRKHRSDRDQATAEWFVSLSVTRDQSQCCDILFCHSERSAAQSRNL